MKKSIATVALVASAASAFAMIKPPAQAVQIGDSTIVVEAPKVEFYCLGLYEDQDGSKILGSCDEKRRNLQFGAEVNELGCTENQAALRVSKDIQIVACPSYVQL